jgi:alpha-1,6-mannosyltransferase
MTVTRPERRIIWLSFITVALYLAIWQLEAAMAPDTGPRQSTSGTAAFWPFALYSAVTLLIVVAYRSIILMSLRGELASGRAQRWALLVPVLLNLLFVAYRPRLSIDAFTYMSHGVLGLLPQGNPLLQPAQDARDTAIGAELTSYGWRQAPGITPYGILWTWIEIGVAKLSGADVLAAIRLFKVVAVVASLGSAWLIWRILGHIHPAVRLPGTLTYLWNPLVLMEFAGEGHNDAVMIFLSLAAVASAIASRPAVSLIAQSLGVMSKYICALFLPAQWIYLWRTDGNRTQLLLQSALALAAIATLLVVLYAPYWAGLRSLDGILHRTYPYGSATLPAVIRGMLKHTPLRPVAGALATAIAFGLLLTVIAWSSLRVRNAADLAKSCAWISVTFVLLAYPDYWPWYACMPLAWICVGELKRLSWLVFLMSISGRLAAPLDVLRIHGHLGGNLTKGLTTGLGALLPGVVLVVWCWHQGLGRPSAARRVSAYPWR